jgi:hypothetical protein
MARGGDAILVRGGLAWIVVKLWCCFMFMASWWKVQTRRLPRRAVRSIEQAHAQLTAFHDLPFLCSYQT